MTPATDKTDNKLRSARHKMEIYRLLLALFVVHTAAHVQAAKLASTYFKICHRSDPLISRCIKNTLEDLRPRLVEGIPDLGIVPMDPLNIPRLEQKEENKNFKMKLVLKNLTVQGIRHTKLLDVRMDFNNLTMQIQMLVPALKFTANYEMDGKVLMLPAVGNGDCTLKFTDVTIACHTAFKLVNRKGEDFLEVQDLKWALDAGTSHFQFNNMFNGDKILGDTVNRFLNENSREAFRAYKYLPEQAFSLIFRDISKKVYRQFSFTELFPE